MRFIQRLRPSSILAYTYVIYILGFIAHAVMLGKTVYGDGIYYYSWLTLDAITGNKYAIGPALVWFPSYHLVYHLGEFARQVAVGVTGVSAAVAGLVLLFRLLSRSFSQTVSIMTVAAVAGTTNLLFYGSVDTVNSHALSFFWVTVFLSFLQSKRWFAVGISLGCIGLVRSQDLVFGLLLFPYISRRTIVPLVAGVVISFVPQLVAWYASFGSFVTSPYLSGHEGFSWLEPHVLGVLFNKTNGLFVWTPITLLAVVGLVRGKYYWYVLVFCVELYLVSTWSTWWQGASYSGRMFVSSLPILAFGIAWVFRWLAANRFTQAYYLLAIILPLSVLNALGIVYFLITLS